MLIIVTAGQLGTTFHRATKIERAQSSQAMWKDYYLAMGSRETDKSDVDKPATDTAQVDTVG